MPIKWIKSLSNSMDSVVPGLFSNLVKKEMSSNGLIFCPINLSFRYPDWSILIIEGNTFLQPIC